MSEDRSQAAMKQMEFNWSRGEAASAPRAHAPAAVEYPFDLRHELEHRTALQIQLTITNNTSTLMTIRKDRLRAHATLRLHRMFLEARGPVLDALAAWVKNPRKRAQDGSLDRFMRDNRHQIRKRDHSEAALVTTGTHFDLGELFNEVNRECFEDRIRAAITWGRLPGPSRRRRSIRFGSYLAEENLIRIHPLLDQEFVPRYFIKYIVFHEMLHADVGVATTPTGRRSVHSPEFNGRERAYRDYDRAVAWQNQPSHLRKLLR